MRTFLLFITVGLLALAAVPSARADIVVYTLTSDHCSGGCLVASGGTSFGTITLTDLLTGGVQVQVSLNANYQFVGTGQGATIGWNLNLTPNPTVSATGGNININGTDWTLVNGGVPGIIHLDGTGDFEYGIYCTFCQGGSNAQPSPVTFTVNAAGLTAVNFAELSTGANGGQFFAVDILSSNGKTGFVDASAAGVCTGCQQGNVPEPSSIALLGGVLLFTARTLRRRRRLVY